MCGQAASIARVCMPYSAATSANLCDPAHTSTKWSPNVDGTSPKPWVVGLRFYLLFFFCHTSAKSPLYYAQNHGKTKKTPTMRFFSDHLLGCYRALSDFVKQGWFRKLWKSSIYTSFVTFVSLNSSQGTHNQASDESCQQAIFHDADPMLSSGLTHWNAAGAYRDLWNLAAVNGSKRPFKQKTFIELSKFEKLWT